MIWHSEVFKILIPFKELWSKFWASITTLPAAKTIKVTVLLIWKVWRKAYPQKKLKTAGEKIKLQNFCLMTCDGQNSHCNRCQILWLYRKLSVEHNIWQEHSEKRKFGRMNRVYPGLSSNMLHLVLCQPLELTRLAPVRGKFDIKDNFKLGGVWQ